MKSTETLLLAISAKKRGGKDTVAKFLQRNAREVFGIEPDEVRLYCFADPIKKFCIDVLGLTWDQCYGTDEQKNTPTQYRWEGMPFYERMVISEADKIVSADPEVEYREAMALARTRLPAGIMTARHVMQTVGTQVGRSYDPALWIKALMRQIASENPPVAIIHDLRFANEFEAVRDAGGHVVRLTRCVNVEDPHESEHALDPDWFDWGNFHLVVDNSAQTVEETCRSVADFSKKLWESRVDRTVCPI